METTAQAIYAVHERARTAAPRSYLGVSQLGHECERFLWLSFRGAKSEPFDGRMLRLFDTGQREEARLVAEMRAAGIVVSEAQPDGAQWSVEAFGGHLRGHLDAALHRLPEAPTVWHVGEFKTHNDKSFKSLKADGVKKSKPEHYAQMTIYMGLTDSKRGLYYAINKNDDEIYVERIGFEQEDFDRLLAKAKDVITSPSPPLRISEDPSWFQCKMCDHHDICHGAELPLPNCRSCAHSTPIIDGGWSCAKNGPSIDTHEAQLIGCDMHRYIPDLLSNFAEMLDANQEANWVKYKHKATGKEFYNGDFSSADLHKLKDKSILGDDTVQELRHMFDAGVES